MNTNTSYLGYAYDFSHQAVNFVIDNIDKFIAVGVVIFVGARSCLSWHFKGKVDKNLQQRQVQNNTALIHVNPTSLSSADHVRSNAIMEPFPLLDLPEDLWVKILEMMPLECSRSFPLICKRVNQWNLYKIALSVQKNFPDLATILAKGRYLPLKDANRLIELSKINLPHMPIFVDTTDDEKAPFNYRSHLSKIITDRPIVGVINDDWMDWSCYINYPCDNWILLNNLEIIHKKNPKALQLSLIIFYFEDEDIGKVIKFIRRFPYTNSINLSLIFKRHNIEQLKEIIKCVLSEMESCKIEITLHFLDVRNESCNSALLDALRSLKKLKKVTVFFQAKHRSSIDEYIKMVKGKDSPLKNKTCIYLQIDSSANEADYADLKEKLENSQIEYQLWSA